MNRPISWVLAAAILTFVALAHNASGNGIEAVAEVYDDGWRTDGGEFILGDTVEFSGANSVGTNLSYMWDVDNRTDVDLNDNYTDDMDATGPNFTWVYESAHNRSVTLTIMHGNRSINASVWVNMSVNRPPSLFVGSFSALVGETVDILDQIDAEDPEGRPLVLEMDLDHDDDPELTWTSEGGGDTEHVFTGPGTFQVRVWLSDGYNIVFDAGNVTVLDPGTVKSVSGRYSKDDHILPGAYFAYKVSLDKGDVIDLNYRVVKGKGKPRLLVMEAKSFFLFKNYEQRNSITLMEELSNPNGTLAEIISWEADRDGTFYFVIDNGYQSGGGEETVSYLIIIDIDRKRETPGFEAATAVMSVLGAVLIVALRRRDGA